MRSGLLEREELRKKHRNMQRSPREPPEAFALSLGFVGFSTQAVDGIKTSDGIWSQDLSDGATMGHIHMGMGRKNVWNDWNTLW